jgi:hypothetical protein
MAASQGVSMSEDAKAADIEFVRAQCEMRGLGRAFALFPEIVTGAFTRGRRPIAALPQTFTATTEPASRFAADPEPAE